MIDGSFPQCGCTPLSKPAEKPQSSVAAVAKIHITINRAKKIARIFCRSIRDTTSPFYIILTLETKRDDTRSLPLVAHSIRASTTP